MILYLLCETVCIERSLTQRAIVLGLAPELDTIRVEEVTLVTRQSGDHVRLHVLYHAYAALSLRLVLFRVKDARNSLQLLHQLLLPHLLVVPKESRSPARTAIVDASIEIKNKE